MGDTPKVPAAEKSTDTHHVVVTVAPTTGNADPSNPDVDAKASDTLKEQMHAKVADDKNAKPGGYQLLGKEVMHNGHRALAYTSLDDVRKDMAHFANEAGKSAEGAAEFTYMLKHNKDNPTPEVMKIMEEELHRQYDAASGKEKERLGLVAAAYAKEDLGYIAANSAPEQKAFFMGAAHNPKYADMPADLMSGSNEGEQRKQTLKQGEDYIKSKISDAPASAQQHDAAPEKPPQRFATAEVDGGMKTPLPATNTAGQGRSGNAAGL